MQCHDNHTEKGFTLVEMLVIAPLIIVIIAGLISAMILITGNILESQEESRLAYNVQSALTRIEADIHSSASFPSTTGSVTSPQGSAEDTSAWTSNSSGPLVLSVNGTTENPLVSNGTNSLSYISLSPNLCGTASAVYNTPYTLYVVYFIRNGSLWKRTILPDVYILGTDLGQPSTSNLCQVPWQKNSCTSGTTGGNCATADDLVLENAQTMTVTPIMNGGVQDGATITLTAQNTAAAQTISFTGSVYAISTNASPTF